MTVVPSTFRSTLIPRRGRSLGCYNRQVVQNMSRSLAALDHQKRSNRATAPEDKTEEDITTNRTATPTPRYRYGLQRYVVVRHADVNRNQSTKPRKASTEEKSPTTRANNTALGPSGNPDKRPSYTHHRQTKHRTPRTRCHPSHQAHKGRQGSHYGRNSNTRGTHGERNQIPSWATDTAETEQHPSQCLSPRQVLDAST